MSDLKRGLSEAVAAAFAAAGLPAELGRVTPSDRPDLADFQCNGALPAAKDMAALRGRDVGVPYRPSLPTPAGAARDGFVHTMTAAGLL